MDIDELLENIRARVEIVPTEYDLTCRCVLFQLGVYYYEISLEQSIKFYKMAANAGSCSASNQLGFIYMQQCNVDLAIHYYKIATAHGNLMALRNLGIIYARQKDYTTAIHYFKLAVDKNCNDDMSKELLEMIYLCYNKLTHRQHNILPQYCI